MSNYHEVMQWHQQHDDLMQTQGDETDGEASYNRKYVTQKLNHGLHRIWKVKQEIIKQTETLKNNACTQIVLWTQSSAFLRNFSWEEGGGAEGKGKTKHFS